MIARPLSCKRRIEADGALGVAATTGRTKRSRRTARLMRKIKKVLEKTKKWSKVLIDMVLLMFEQMAYGEYMSWEPVDFDEDDEKKEKFD